MKKFLSHGLSWGAILCAVSLLGVARLGAQATNAASASMPAPMLDHDEMTQLKAAREKVFASHPDLKAENAKLKAMHDANASPTPQERDATFAEWKDYQKKMRAEMLKVDPTLQPILAKIDAARRNGAAAPFQPASAK